VYASGLVGIVQRADSGYFTKILKSVWNF
jgi:hypothetical protein